MHKHIRILFYRFITENIELRGGSEELIAMLMPLLEFFDKTSQHLILANAIAGSAEHAHINTQRSQNTLYNASALQKSRGFTVCL